MTQTSNAGTARRHRRHHRPEWLAPAGLIALTLVPMAAGSSRLAQLGSGAEVTAENARFFDSPVPVIAHIIGSTVFLLLGALQFAPSLRRRRWHRLAGRVVAPAGLVSAASGLWMAVAYDLPANSGVALMVIRVVLAPAMAAAIIVAVLAIRRGDVATHSAWMTRAYAIGLGAGTQVLTILPWALVVGEPGEVAYTVLMALGWAINLVVAEVVIRARVRRGMFGPRAASGGRIVEPSAPDAAHLS
ncbi:DUF2306 domain-containing protein [Agromyces sp. Leaf222]|uniref:DUF2306 domain-containing protein n=1 Tax=Agromyces sp. Leaf222 TaxID=1735688 RepID=UPI0006F281FA|nr:DUF2306 domain-containing protein [Agromyces sp. Leaf222]KQM82630.1 hypothetical protein ASE68_04530 [Agromyces sp. Leaf222]